MGSSRRRPHDHDSRYKSQMSLFWRVFVLNAAVFVVGTLVLALSPATVSFPVELAEAIVLVVGLGTILLINLALVRLSFAPLERLSNLMRRIDLLRPGQRLDVTGPREVRELGYVFNEMLERLERERQESARTALAAQEAERKRVAQELHDGVGQTLTALLLQLNRLVALLPEQHRESVREAQEAARSSLDETRRIARELRPEALDDLGLASALAALAARFSEHAGIPVRRSIEPLPPLGPDVELVLYRVAQECLTNVARHAGASRVELELREAGPAVELRVADDGRGLGASASDGTGIRGMRERAMLVGGTLSVGNRDGGGVEIRLEVPVGERA